MDLDGASTMRKLLLAAVSLLALSAPAWAVDPSVSMGNANYASLCTDTKVVTGAALTAARTITLPYAGCTVVGQGNPAILTNTPPTWEFFDTLGTITATNTITITPQSGDTINGSPASL